MVLPAVRRRRVLARADSEGAEMVAVNVRCLDDVDIASLKLVPFDGRSL